MGGRRVSAYQNVFVWVSAADAPLNPPQTPSIGDSRYSSSPTKLSRLKPTQVTFCMRYSHKTPLRPPAAPTGPRHGGPRAPKAPVSGRKLAAHGAGAIDDAQHTRRRYIAAISPRARSRDRYRGGAMRGVGLGERCRGRNMRCTLFAMGSSLFASCMALAAPTSLCTAHPVCVCGCMLRLRTYACVRFCVYVCIAYVCSITYTPVCVCSYVRRLPPPTHHQHDHTPHPCPHCVRVC